MLLVELTIDGTLNRISSVGHALTNYWDNKIIGFANPVRNTATNHGGYCEMKFGNITLNPDLFSSDWPPPLSCAITIKYTATTQEAAETLLVGTAHRSQVDRGRIIYSLNAPSYDETVADATAYNDTLNAVLTTILTGIAEIDTLDTSAARAASPNVTHTVSGDQLSIKLASDIAAFYGHLFYVSGSTAYLVDMLLDNGTQTLTEFDYFARPEYKDSYPIAVARTDNFARTSSYPYGTELSVAEFHTTEANVNTALDDIITIENRAKCRVKMPLLGSLPAPGKKISWTDTALNQNTDAYLRVRSLRYDLVTEKVELEGEGELTLTATPTPDALDPPVFYLLEEGGDDLLTEDGDRIILE